MKQNILCVFLEEVFLILDLGAVALGEGGVSRICGDYLYFIIQSEDDISYACFAAFYMFRHHFRHLCTRKWISHNKSDKQRVYDQNTCNLLCYIVSLILDLGAVALGEGGLGGLEGKQRNMMMKRRKDKTASAYKIYETLKRQRLIGG